MCQSGFDTLPPQKGNNSAMATREEKNQALRDEYGELFDQIMEILFRHDPVGINFEVNTDEYSPEARTILPSLRGCHSVEDTQRLVHQEFQAWFGLKTAGPYEWYAACSTEIWQAWLKAKDSIVSPPRMPLG